MGITVDRKSKTVELDVIDCNETNCGTDSCGKGKNNNVNWNGNGNGNGKGKVNGNGNWNGNGKVNETGKRNNKHINKKPTEDLTKIISQLDPSLFFDAIAYEEHKSKLIRFTVSYHHNIIYERLQQIIHTNNVSQLIRGILTIGAIVVTKWYNIDSGITEDLIRKTLNCRMQYYMEISRGIVDDINHELTHRCVDHQKKYIQLLLSALNTYPSNTYIKSIYNAVSAYSSVYNDINTEVQNQTPPHLPVINSFCMQTLKDLIATELDDKCFKLRRDSNNVCYTLRIHPRLCHMGRRVTSIARITDTISECYRGFFVAGLYSLSKFATTGRLQQQNETYITSAINSINNILFVPL